MGPAGGWHAETRYARIGGRSPRAPSGVRSRGPAQMPPGHGCKPSVRPRVGKDAGMAAVAESGQAFVQPCGLRMEQHLGPAVVARIEMIVGVSVSSLEQATAFGRPPTHRPPAHTPMRGCRFSPGGTIQLPGGARSLRSEHDRTRPRLFPPEGALDQHDVDPVTGHQPHAAARRRERLDNGQARRHR